MALSGSFIGYQEMKRGAFRISACLRHSALLHKCVVGENYVTRHLRYAEDIDAGMVWVNMHTFLDPRYPLWRDERIGHWSWWQRVY
ncbi:hypothetical protein KCP73_16675 [Salmonella enterica subsp. enterica]|nr:hypothetical protein KCP73_16675 [Salmonella enterica subsp. enterica]